MELQDFRICRLWGMLQGGWRWTAVHAIEREQSQEVLREMLREMLQVMLQEAVAVVVKTQEIRLSEEVILAAVVVEEQQLGLAAMMAMEVDEGEVVIED